MYMDIEGDPVHGILHSANASSGVEVPIYKEGSNTAYVIGENEYLVVHSVQLIAALGGDCYLYIGGSGGVSTGETVSRGTYTLNGGIAPSQFKHTGLRAQKPYLVAPVGVVDVKFTGFIRKIGNNTSVRPSWKEDS